MTSSFLAGRSARGEATLSTVVVVVCVVLLIGIMVLLIVPPAWWDVRNLPKVNGSAFLAAWIGLFGLVLAFLTLLLPVFVWQIARETRRTREALERMETLLEVIETAALRRSTEAPARAIEEPQVTIYPVKTPGKERIR